MDKNRDFLLDLPPLLVHVVIECPIADLLKESHCQCHIVGKNDVILATDYGHPMRAFLKLSQMIGPLAGVFYNVKNGSSFIASKILSKNLSNENKHCCFCCLQDKTWIKMPILWNYWDSLTNFRELPENWHFNLRFVLKTTKTPVFVFITEILWQKFWRNKWQSIFNVVKNLRY